MNLKCPICRELIPVDAGSEAFYCRRCGKAFSTARCYYQQHDDAKEEKFLVRRNTLHAYKGDEIEVTVPSNIVVIGAGSFADNHTVESVTLPSSVKVIEPYAFTNCRNLKKVQFGSELERICIGAFTDCVNLQEFRMPEKTKVERGCFMRCSSLKLSAYSESAIKSPEFIGLSEKQVSYRTGGGCYITSAVCERRGEADNCEMLTRFRAFRDNWLVNQPGGAEDVQEYYRTAPTIVDAIHSNERCNGILDGIYQNYLKPCFDLLDKGDYNTCRQVYTQMVRDCEGTYLSQRRE